MSYMLYSIAYQFYCKKFGLDRHIGKDLFMRFLDGFLGNHHPDSGIKSRIYFFIGSHRRLKAPAEAAGLKQLLRHEAQKLLYRDPVLLNIARQGHRKGFHSDAKSFDFVHRISNKTLIHFLDRFMDQLSGANVFDIFSCLGSAGALYSLIAPYFLSFSLCARDRQVTEEIAARFVSARVRPLSERPRINVAHFSDTFYEINGVALTLQHQIHLAKRTGKKGSKWARPRACMQKAGPLKKLLRQHGRCMRIRMWVDSRVRIF